MKLHVVCLCACIGLSLSISLSLLYVHVHVHMYLYLAYYALDLAVCCVGMWNLTKLHDLMHYNHMLCYITIVGDVIVPLPESGVCAFILMLCLSPSVAEYS